MLEQEVLPILSQLEFCCDRAELCNKGKEKSLEITCDDLRVFYVDGNPNFYLVVKYIQKNGIDFTVTFDVEDSPNNYMDKEHPGWEYIQLGIIKDKDINTIKEKIIKLKNKLNGIKEKEDDNIEDIGNLTLLENDTLKILKQLEYSCDRAKFFNTKSKPITVTFGDINFSLLRKGIDLHLVSSKLREEGLNFSITYDLKNEKPLHDVYYGWAESESEVEIGEIKGKSINDIELKIRELINELSSKKEKKSSTSENNINTKGLKIELIYSEKRGIILKSNTILFYAPRKGTDRFYYLKELINNKDKVLSRKHLDKKSRTKKKDNSNQNIITSHSISDMNKIIKKKLKLDYDFILGNGYRINTENYKIEIDN